eukprot:m.82817 g.82817  ORF g.82817 m.82817 type:complete len:167 (+) comp14634_c0_seq9:58-558(+)
MADLITTVLGLKATLDACIESVSPDNPLPEREVRRILGELEALDLSVELLRASKVDRTLDELKNVLGPDHVDIGVQRKRLKHAYRELKREYKRVHGGWSSTRSDSTYLQVPAPPDSLDDFVAPVPVLKIKLGASRTSSHPSTAGAGPDLTPPTREGLDGRTVNGQW